MEYAAAVSALERARIMLEAKERHGDDVSRDVDLAGLEKERILGDQANIVMAMQVCANFSSTCTHLPTGSAYVPCNSDAALHNEQDPVINKRQLPRHPARGSAGCCGL